MTHSADTLETLRLRLALHEAQLEAALDGVLLVDPAGRVVHSSRRFAELWGMPAALLESGDDQAMMAYVLPLLVDPQAFVDGVEALYAEPDRTACDELLLRDGRVYERYTAPAIGPDGHGFGRIWFFRDITERRRAREYTERLQALNEELQAKQEELERLTRIKDEFLAVVSHELRTPLTVIKNAAAILLKGKAGTMNEVQAQFSAVIMENVGRLGRLVDDILDFQRIEGGKQEAEQPDSSSQAG